MASKDNRSGELSGWYGNEEVKKGVLKKSRICAKNHRMSATGCYRGGDCPAMEGRKTLRSNRFRETLNGDKWKGSILVVNNLLMEVK